MSIWDSLVGNFNGQKSRSDINTASDQAQGYVRQGAADSNALVNAGRDQAIGYVDPYMKGGQAGQTAYENTLGLHGQDARQQQFQTGYLDSPEFKYFQNANLAANTASWHRWNASPQGANSGSAMLAASRAQLERFNQDYGNYQNRLQGLGQQGYGASQFAGQTAYGAGVQTGNTTGSAYNALAQNAINKGSALSNSYVGWNNFMGLLGTGANAAATAYKQPGGAAAASSAAAPSAAASAPSWAATVAMA